MIISCSSGGKLHNPISLSMLMVSEEVGYLSQGQEGGLLILIESCSQLSEGRNEASSLAS